ncbi:MAG: dockerin type I repeat-containing protein [Clostridia bacterium]|nr:dockerin type I repeat-containing protein [Clostridia bacterium]
MKKFLSVILAAALLVCCVVPAFAAGRIAKEEEKPYYVEFFNKNVNSIKTEMPKAVVTFNNYVPDGGITAGGTSPSDEIDDMAKKYLIPVLEGLFNNRSSVAKSFIKTLFGDQGSTVEKIEYHKGTLRDKSLPVYGEKYVSALTPASDYDIAVYQDVGFSEAERLIISFPDMTLEDAENSSIAKVFSLPSGTLDPTIISGERTELVSRLDDAKLTDFNVKNAQILTRYDKNGVITYYGSVIDYSFSLSFYDCMNLISAVLGYNFYTAVMNTLATIMENVGRTGISSTELLQDRQLHITYRRVVEIDKIDFTSRLFGDIDDDKAVTASDARAALRHAVKLDLITASNDQIYGDVDFDGQITSSDARLILRMAVGLEKKFSEVPEGKSIVVAKVEEPIVDPEETPSGDDPGEDDPDDPGGGVAGIFDNFDPTIKLEDIANAVFAYIGFVENAEGDIQGSITDWIEAIRQLIEESREENNP